MSEIHLTGEDWDLIIEALNAYTDNDAAEPLATQIESMRVKPAYILFFCDQCQNARTFKCSVCEREFQFSVPQVGDE